MSGVAHKLSSSKRKLTKTHPSPEESALTAACGQKLCNAAWQGDAIEVTTLLSDENVASFINLPNPRGQCALYCAARQGHVGVLLELLKCPHIDLNAQVPDHGATPLHAASFENHDEVVAMLLASGANYSLKNKIGLDARQEAKGTCLDVYSIFLESGTKALMHRFPNISLLSLDESNMYLPSKSVRVIGDRKGSVAESSHSDSKVVKRSKSADTIKPRSEGSRGLHDSDGKKSPPKSEPLLQKVPSESHASPGGFPGLRRDTIQRPRLNPPEGAPVLARTSAFGSRCFQTIGSVELGGNRPSGIHITPRGGDTSPAASPPQRSESPITTSLPEAPFSSNDPHAFQLPNLASTAKNVESLRKNNQTIAVMEGSSPPKHSSNPKPLPTPGAREKEVFPVPPAATVPRHEHPLSFSSPGSFGSLRQVSSLPTAPISPRSEQRRRREINETQPGYKEEILKRPSGFRRQPVALVLQQAGEEGISGGAKADDPPSQRVSPKTSPRESSPSASAKREIKTIAGSSPQKPGTPPQEFIPGLRTDPPNRGSQKRLALSPRSSSKPHLKAEVSTPTTEGGSTSPTSSPRPASPNPLTNSGSDNNTNHEKKDIILTFKSSNPSQFEKKSSAGNVNLGLSSSGGEKAPAFSLDGIFHSKHANEAQIESVISGGKVQPSQLIDISSAIMDGPDPFDSTTRGGQPRKKLNRTRSVWDEDGPPEDPQELFQTKTPVRPSNLPPGREIAGPVCLMNDPVPMRPSKPPTQFSQFLSNLEDLEKKTDAFVNRVIEEVDQALIKEMQSNDPALYLETMTFICSKKTLSRLGVAAKAALIGALCPLRFSMASRKQLQRICEIVLDTNGEALSELRDTLDYHGGYDNLHRILYDYLEKKERKLLIRHIHHNSNFQKTKKPIKILSDIDDTWLSSGGAWPAGVDDVFPKKVPYPGVFAFYKELDEYGNTDSKTKTQNCSNLTFITAKPHAPGGVTEDHSYKQFKQYKQFHTNPSLLSGDLGSFGIVFGAFDPIVEKKVQNFIEYITIYPDHNFVFVGDNGQGDYKVGLQMLDSHSSFLQKVFIHRVIALEDTFGIDKKKLNDNPNIFFFDTYVGAALEAYQSYLISQEGLIRIINAAKEDFINIRNSCKDGLGMKRGKSKEREKKSLIQSPLRSKPSQKKLNAKIYQEAENAPAYTLTPAFSMTEHPITTIEEEIADPKKLFEVYQLASKDLDPNLELNFDFGNELNEIALGSGKSLGELIDAGSNDGIAFMMEAEIVPGPLKAALAGNPLEQSSDSGKRGRPQVKAKGGFEVARCELNKDIQKANIFLDVPIPGIE